MDHMTGRLSDPYLGLPRNFSQILHHRLARHEGRDEHKACLGTLKQALELPTPLGVHRTVACDRFNEHQPILGGVMNNNIWHLTVSLDFNTEFRECGLVKVSPFMLR